jgi:hypothetical protein
MRIKMPIYGLTLKGIYAYRNPRNPDTDAYRILNCLYRAGRADMGRICAATGLTPMQVSRLMRTELRGCIGKE